MTTLACDKSADATKDAPAKTAEEKAAEDEAIARALQAENSGPKAFADKPSPKSPAAAAEAAQETAEKTRLLTPGAEPRRALRYAFTKGRTKAFSMKMHVQMGVEMGGKEMPGMPPMELEIGGTTTTTTVSDKGDATRDVTFTSFKPIMANAPPEAAMQAQAQLAQFSGMALTETVSGRGEVTDRKVDVATLQNPQAMQFFQNLQEGMSNVLLPLPEEAIGLGGTWEDKTVVKSSGLAVTQIGTFKLVKLTGDQATIEVTFKQSASPGEISDPRLPPGAKTEILKMEGDGAGSSQVNFKSLDVKTSVNISNAVETKISGLPAQQGAPGEPPGPTEVRSKMSTTIKLDVELKAAK